MKGSDACSALRVDISVCGILLDELSARLNIITHKHGENLVSLGSIVDCHLLQEACLRVHCSVPKLLRVHLTQTFVALGVELAVVSVAAAVSVDESLAVLLSVAVLLLVLVRTAVEWWSGDVEVAFLNDFRHESEEESHDKCVDVRAIDVGIGHDDNLVITQFVDVSLLGVLAIYAETHTDGLQDDVHGLSLEHFVPLHFLHVEDFPRNGSIA